MTFAPDNVHASIGKAILAAQYLEQWLVNAYYCMRIVTEDDFSLSDAQLSDYRLFKTPTKNLIKVLSQRSQIDADLETRINNLLEQRHLVIHRWFLLNGTPAAHTPTKWEELAAVAESVASEATQLSFLLLGYLRDNLHQRLSGEEPDQVKKHMAQLFRELENAPNNSFKPNPLRGSA